jgi:hypothetical protein
VVIGSDRSRTNDRTRSTAVVETAPQDPSENPSPRCRESAR